MAQKRMFDKSITDTDSFMDLPLSAKAMYFLLGMDADDEGFVSPRKVMRVHGGNEDDIKLLIGKKYLIPFKSGVVVITDWNNNNWLDSRRIKPTKYQEERKLLAINKDNSYVLSDGLADVKPEESRVEEKRDFALRNAQSHLPSSLNEATKLNNTDISIRKTDEEGNELPEKKPVSPRNFAGATAMRIRGKFIFLCQKTLQVSPVADLKSIKIINRVLDQKTLTEHQMYDLFEEWFLKTDKTDEQLIQITQALSSFNINCYKVVNNVK